MNTPEADNPATPAPLPVTDITAETFAPFGTLIPPAEDGVPFGPQDAQLHLSEGIPRFYIMRIPGRGNVIDRITRHRKVTQVLAAAGTNPWLIAVAPPDDPDSPDATPARDALRAFRIPPGVAIMLFSGTWHAGPLFEKDTEESFFNLELADTNITDHHTETLSPPFELIPPP